MFGKSRIKYSQTLAFAILDDGLITSVLVHCFSRETCCCSPIYNELKFYLNCRRSHELPHCHHYLYQVSVKLGKVFYPLSLTLGTRVGDIYIYIVII